jgi:DNA-binding FrmR family transcriptional regulator
MSTTSHTGPHGYSDHKEGLQRRLARIEGQVRGISRMVDEDRYCIDILTQISAVQKAVDAVALQLLDDHVRHCVIGSSGTTQEERTGELMAAVGRLVKS